MRISDWSSDVCSSDLTEVLRELDRLVHYALRFFGIAHLNITGERKVLALRMTLEPIDRQDTAQVAVAGEDYAIHVIDFSFQPDSQRPDVSDDIGSAKCRARECQYVCIPV